MKKLLLLLFVLSFRASASQWYVGVPVNDSMLTGSFNGNNNCYPALEGSLMYPVSNVTGVKYALIVRTITIANTIYTTQNGLLNVGDSLFFTTTNPIYDFYYPVAGSSFTYVIRAVGTPQVAGQNYPCGSYVEICTLPLCQYTCMYSFSSQCTVQLASNIIESENELDLSVYPNPVSDKLNLKVKRTEALIIFNSLGEEIKKQDLLEGDNTIDISDQPKGIYLVKVVDEKGNFGIKKIIKL